MTSAVDQTTRSRLLDAACSLLQEKRFGEITTRAIAERAGVNSGLLHYHFGTKLKLLLEAAFSNAGDEVDVPVRLMADANSFGEGVAAVLQWIGDLDVSVPSVRQLFDITAEALRRPEVQGVVAQALEGSRGEMANALAARRDVSPAMAERLSSLITALFDGAMLHRMVDPSVDVAGWTAAVEYLCPPIPDAEG